MEEDLMHIETQIQQLESDKKAIAGVDMSKIERIVSRVKFFLENMDKLMLKQIDPVKKAQFFGVLFDRIPRYSEINSGTPSLLPLDLCFEATKKTQESLESLVVTHVDQTWNQVLTGLERIDTIVEESLESEDE